MNKREFIAHLEAKLSGLPGRDIEERLAFYSEMIDDRMEEGRSEEEAVAEIGSAQEIAAQIIADGPLAKTATAQSGPKRRPKAWEIWLLALGSPLWLSLAVAALAVVLSLYIALWSVIISLWAVFGSLIGCALGGVVASLPFIFGGNGLTGIGMIGAGSVCAGLAIFLFLGCRAATRGTLLLTKRGFSRIKNGFAKKEAA